MQLMEKLFKLLDRRLLRKPQMRQVTSEISPSAKLDEIALNSESTSHAAQEEPVLLRLSAESESYLGPVPCLPVGASGHQILKEQFFNLVEIAGSDIFCDIGANQGEVGRQARTRIPSAVVFGFEANPRIHEVYAGINRDAGVQWQNLAVTDRSGTVDLFIPRVLERAFIDGRLVNQRVEEAEDTGKSSLLLRDENVEYDIVSVSAVSIDEFLQVAAPEGRLALWIDVEGAAAAVLDGAKGTLRRTDVLMIEVEGFAFWKDQALVERILERLRLAGFVTVLRDREYEDAQFNMLSVRKTDAFVEVQRAMGKVAGSASDATLDLPPLLARNTPVLVPCFNNPTFCARMLPQLKACGFEDIRFVDNASSERMMHAVLEELEAQGAIVERLPENLGPMASIFTESRLAALPRYFCVTDPDLEFNPALPDNFLGEMANAMETWKRGKVGFALDISDRSIMKKEKFKITELADYHIWEWEEQFWQKRLGFTGGNDPIYDAAVDTTFALYDQSHFSIEMFMNALRIAGRYTACHIPWLDKRILPHEEEKIYRETQMYSYYLGTKEAK